MFSAGAAVFTLASLACGLAPTAGVLVAARVVQGVGGALMVAQVLSGIQLTFSGRARVRAIGSYAMALSLAAVLGQVLGGLVVSANLFGTSWRPAFLINVPIGLGLVLAGLRWLPLKRGTSRDVLDLPGVAALTAAVLLILVPLIFGREQHWPLWTWLCLALGVPAVGLFVAIERRTAARGATPIVNLRLLTERAVGWGLIASGAAIGTYFSMLFVLALYLQQGLGRSPLFSGLALVSWVAAFGLSGLVLKRVPAAAVPRVATAGYVILASSYAGLGLSVISGRPAGDAALMILLGIGGLGLGLGRNSSVADMTGAVPDRYAADMSGLINTDSQLAGAASLAVFGTLYLSLASQPGQAVRAFLWVNVGFAVVALLGAGASVLAFRGRTRRRLALELEPQSSQAA